MATVLCLAGAAGAASPTPAFAADAPGRGHWTWQNPLPNGNDLAAACASQTVCYVTGIPGGMLVTTDGGSTWRAKSLNLRGVTGSMSCPSLLVCYLGVGDMILHTSDGWSSWDQQRSPITVLPPTIAFVGGLSCPSETTCFGIVPTGSMHPGPTYIISTNDSGKTWVDDTPGGAGQLASIGCPNARTCYATGAFGSIIATKDAWATWSAQVSTVQFDLGGVSCAEANVCAIAGWNQAITTVDGGIHWTTHPTSASTNGSLTGMSCPTASRCVATGRDGDPMIAVASNDGGATWQTVYRPSSQGWLGSVSCPTVASCVAAGEHGWIAVTHDGGATWSSPSSGSSTQLNAISCPTEMTCFAAGEAGTVLATANDGAKWTATPTGSGGSLRGISCADESNCTAVGLAGTMIQTSDAGLHWTTIAWGTTPGWGAPEDLFSVSCPASTHCVAVGQYSTSIVIGRGTAQPPQRVSPYTAFGVSCPSVMTCYLVGSSDAFMKNNGAIQVSRDGGTSWTSQQSNDPAQIQAISCTVGTTACTAVDQTGGMVSSTDGATWSVHPVANGFTAISCPATGACVALSQWDGIISTNDSGMTSQVQPTAATRQLLGVSCPSVAVCTVVGENGAILSSRTRVVPSGLPVAPSLAPRSNPPPPPPPLQPAAGGRAIHLAVGVLRHRVS